MNRLGNETSPYLLQHADNPVDWYPWGEEAWIKARAENKPVLLSIGYSACHWCHVMAHESFENAEIAAVMNEHFVNIKVDREERPDIDRIYQTAHQLIARRPGGWPLTMFLHPDDQRPFFGGTYFPDQPRHGMPAFPELLARVAGYYRDQQEEIREQGDALLQAFARLEPGEAASADGLRRDPLDSARERFLEQFDSQHGGFGSAPKFPHTSSLERLLRHWRESAHGAEPDTQALFAVALSLTRMAEGGVYDQLGGGFFRYSVDADWTIPHFEKMLYDNGPLLALYAQMWLVSADEAFRRVANETADWAIRDLRAPGGAFFATLDADSDGGEGSFYVWQPEQAQRLLEADEFAVLAAHFGLDLPANLEGRWHLRVMQSLEETAGAAGVNLSAAQRLLDSARSKLLAAREARNWPGRDEKILVSWNALAIRGLAIASRALHRDDLATAAAHALDFIRDELVADDRLLAVFKDGHARFPAYLDDHAFLLDATLELLQARWQSEQLQFAIWLAERLLEEFEDRERGGFYFTGAHHESLMHRSRPMSDQSLPSGNAVAALALNRLGHLLGETRYLASAERAIRAAWPAMSEFPHGHASMLHALEEYLEPPVSVVIRGESGELAQWLAELNGHYAPRRQVFGIPSAARDLPGLLAERQAGGTTRAYVCQGTSCLAPIDSLAGLAAELSEAGGG